jgi:hypothetical protein
MTGNDVLNTIETIIDLQVEESFILTGMCLPPREIAVLEQQLEPDDPDTGAIGRYKGIPIFREADFQGMQERLPASTRQLDTVKYSFVRMGVVN